MSPRNDSGASGPRRLAWAGVLAWVAMMPAHAQDDGVPKGVNPKDLVTKVDVIVRHDAFEGGVSLDSLTLKYDRGLNAEWGIAIEVPLARFKAQGVSDSGLAESKLKFRRVENKAWGAWLVGGEFVVPTDSERTLGSGKWQVNPSFGAVISLSPTVFAFGGYQHMFSVAGRDDAPKINQSQPRVIVAKLNPAGWWVMTDLKYTIDHETSAKTFDAEFEAGRMLTRDSALSLRLIESGMDSTRRWGAVVSLRYLF